MNWDDVRIFVALVRAQSLTVAARRLGVEHSTVSRRIDNLEKTLGLRLFDRLPRAWQLTAEGQQLFARAEAMEESADAFAREAADGASLAGNVRLSAPSTLGSVFLLPALAACHARWQSVTLELVGESRIASLARREADLAVRIGQPQEPGLAARPLGTLGYGLFARCGYFAQPAEDWRFVGYDDSLRHVPEHQWINRFADGRPFVLRSNKLSALHEAARAGLGIAVLPRFLAATAPELEALAGAVPPSRELWLAVHPDVRRSPRVRLIADLIVELCAASAAPLAPETAR